MSKTCGIAFHVNQRTIATDVLAESLALHAFGDRFPNAEAPELEWIWEDETSTQIDGQTITIPAHWLLFAHGTQREDIPE